MTTKARKISKEEGVQKCADLLFLGTPTKEILRTMAETCGVSESSIEKWLRQARPIAASKRLEAEQVRKREMEAAVAESAKKLNITREAILSRLWAIANANLKQFFTGNNNAINITKLPDEVAALLASIEVDELYHGSSGQKFWVGQTKKFKLHDPLKAIDMVIKMQGWYKEDNSGIPVKLVIGYGQEVPV